MNCVQIPSFKNGNKQKPTSTHSTDWFESHAPVASQAGRVAISLSLNPPPLGRCDVDLSVHFTLCTQGNFLAF